MGQDKKQGTGKLYVVATPIGDMEDITLRALRVLKDVDIIAAEDTRKTLRLLAFHGIEPRGRLLSCHEHNEDARARGILQKLQAGSSVAIVTDAGTPSVSDPGFKLVRGALENGIDVVPVPGASAAVTALSVSGLSTDRFLFEGFLPKKKGERSRRLERLALERATIIFYESPKRIAALLKELLESFGERRAVLCREMTKPYEQFMRGTISELLAAVQEAQTVRGEITLVVEGATDKAVGIDQKELEREVGNSDLGASELAAMLAKRYGLPRRAIYKEVLRIKGKET